MSAGDGDGIELHEFDLLKPYDALVACCSGRRGGVSEPPYCALNVGLHVEDDPEAVLENRARLAARLGIQPDSFVFCGQVHGDRVALVTAAHRGRGARATSDAIADSDALITSDVEVALAVMVADCVPVLIFDPDVPAVGVAHAGWQGTVLHVARKTVAAMQREFSSDPARLLAGIGPSIGPASYAVGANVAARAETEFPQAKVVQATTDGRLLLDLWSCNVVDLVDAGLSREHIELAGVDTYESVDGFFSHRRQSPTGRFLAVSMLRP